MFREYRRARAQLNAIRSGCSTLHLHGAYARSGPDRDAILRDIAILLTRRIGRVLFARLEATGSTVSLVKHGGRTCYDAVHRRVYIASDRPAVATFQGVTPAGRAHDVPAPRFVALAHELIRRLHWVWTKTAKLDRGRTDGLFIPECG